MAAARVRLERIDDHPPPLEGPGGKISTLPRLSRGVNSFLTDSSSMITAPETPEKSARWKSFSEIFETPADRPRSSLMASLSVGAPSGADEPPLSFDQVLVYCAGARDDEREALLRVLKEEPTRAAQCDTPKRQPGDQARPSGRMAGAQCSPPTSRSATQCQTRAPPPPGRPFVSMDQQTQAAGRSTVQDMPDGGLMLVTPEVTLTIRGPVARQQTPW